MRCIGVAPSRSPNNSGRRIRRRTGKSQDGQFRGTWARTSRHNLAVAHQPKRLERGGSCFKAWPLRTIASLRWGLPCNESKIQSRGWARNVVEVLSRPDLTANLMDVSGWSVKLRYEF